jgi:superfamily II DNA/RNA helicase
MVFASLSLGLQRAISKAGFNRPTPIQERVIPLILEGKDLVAEAETGSGKSASFVLPILEYLEKNPQEGKAKIRVLVLAPTRELTQQVAEDFVRFGLFLSKPPKVLSIIGGEGIGQQLYDIQQGCDVVVATSGRLLDIFSKKQMNLSKLAFFVLDEADKMLDLGFEKELDFILQAIPKKRQNLLFSATYHDKMHTIATKVTSDWVMVKEREEQGAFSTINQRVIEVSRDHRGPLLRALLKQHKWKRVLVFMANKRAADNIAYKFRKRGFLADSFHGDLSQEERNETLRAFKDRKVDILFSTDLAARGLHIEGIEVVINFDLPRSPTDYIHRIGRTGRAGRMGEAISLIDFEDMAHFKLIEKRCNISLKRESIKGFELLGEAPKKVKGKAPVKGRRKSKKDKLREAAAKRLS